jgi:hypothetical protein
MKLKRKLSRRSFLATVTGAVATGGALAAFGGEAGALQVTDSDPGDPVGRGRGGSSRSGITDRDPTDPSGRGRGGSGRSGHTGVTDGDPNDPIGSGRGGGAARSGCSDSDPTDPGGNGRSCGSGRGTGTGDPGHGQGQGEAAYQTGRRERRYEVCWVDHPSRTNEECNVQTYSEWAVTYSDGRVEYETAESQGRQAEMTARGYTARWHRMLVNEW